MLSLKGLIRQNAHSLSIFYSDTDLISEMQEKNREEELRKDISE